MRTCSAVGVIVGTVHTPRATAGRAALGHSSRVQNVWQGKCLRTYSGHRNQKFCCFNDFSTTGRHMIVGGSEDGKVASAMDALSSLCAWSV